MFKSKYCQKINQLWDNRNIELCGIILKKKSARNIQRWRRPTLLNTLAKRLFKESSLRSQLTVTIFFLRLDSFLESTGTKHLSFGRCSLRTFGGSKNRTKKLAVMNQMCYLFNCYYCEYFLVCKSVYYCRLRCQIQSINNNFERIKRNQSIENK